MMNTLFPRSAISYHSITSDISDNDSNRAAFTREYTLPPPHEMAALVTSPYRMHYSIRVQPLFIICTVRRVGCIIFVLTVIHLLNKVEDIQSVFLL